MIPILFKFLRAAPCPRFLQAALSEVEDGVRETPGPRSTRRIIDYRVMAKIAIGGDDGEVPWCAIFVNAMLESTGAPGSRSAMARSFVRNAGFKRLDRPCLGAVTVLSSSRGPSSGHVGFYVGSGPGRLWLAGGNQNDACTIDDFADAKLVGHFWPVGLPLPAAPWDRPFQVSAPPSGKPVRDA